MPDFSLMDYSSARIAFLKLMDRVEEDQKVFDENELSLIFNFIWKDMDDYLEEKGATEGQILFLNNEILDDGSSTVEQVHHFFHKRDFDEIKRLVDPDNKQNFQEMREVVQSFTDHYRAINWRKDYILFTDIADYIDHDWSG